MNEIKPINFINEQVEVYFGSKPLLEKKPGCPISFTWKNRIYEIEYIINEWHDYQRRGRFRHNMRETHANIAKKRGSWGVGEDYYRVITQTDQIFDLYYTRSPKDSSHRKGAWFLFQELKMTAIEEC